MKKTNHARRARAGERLQSSIAARRPWRPAPTRHRPSPPKAAGRRRAGPAAAGHGRYLGQPDALLAGAQLPRRMAARPPAPLANDETHGRRRKEEKKEAGRVPPLCAAEGERLAKACACAARARIVAALCEEDKWDNSRHGRSADDYTQHAPPTSVPYRTTMAAAGEGAVVPQKTANQRRLKKVGTDARLRAGRKDR